MPNEPLQPQGHQREHRRAVGRLRHRLSRQPAARPLAVVIAVFGGLMTSVGVAQNNEQLTPRQVILKEMNSWLMNQYGDQMVTYADDPYVFYRNSRNQVNQQFRMFVKRGTTTPPAPPKFWLNSHNTVTIYNGETIYWNRPELGRFEQEPLKPEELDDLFSRSGRFAEPRFLTLHQNLAPAPHLHFTITGNLNHLIPGEWHDKDITIDQAAERKWRMSVRSDMPEGDELVTTLIVRNTPTELGYIEDIYFTRQNLTQQFDLAPNGKVMVNPLLNAELFELERIGPRPPANAVANANDGDPTDPDPQPNVPADVEPLKAGEAGFRLTFEGLLNQLPNFEYRGSLGEIVNWTDFHELGKTPAVIVFWSSENDGRKLLDAALQATRDARIETNRRIKLMAINVDGEVAEVSRLNRRYVANDDFIFVIDEKSRIQESLAVELLPSLLVVNDNNSLRAFYAGFGETTLDDLRQRLQEESRSTFATRRE